MNKHNDMRGESRATENSTTNAPDSRSHSRDNSGMHAGGSRGSSFRQQSDNPVQYGSKKGSYWEEKGSDREPDAESRMNGQSPNKK